MNHPNYFSRQNDELFRTKTPLRYRAACELLASNATDKHFIHKDRLLNKDNPSTKCKESLCLMTIWPRNQTYLKVRWWNIRSFIMLQYLLLTPKYSQDRATPLEYQNKGHDGAIGNLEYRNL